METGILTDRSPQAGPIKSYDLHPDSDFEVDVDVETDTDDHPLHNIVISSVIDQVETISRRQSVRCMTEMAHDPPSPGAEPKPGGEWEPTEDEIDMALMRIERLATSWSNSFTQSLDIRRSDDISEAINQFNGMPVDSVEISLTMREPTQYSGDSVYVDLACHMCHHSGFEKMDGYWCCPACGLMGDRVTDMGAEHRYFGTGTPDLGRCGMPTNPLFPNNNLSTMVSGGRNPYLRKIHFWNSSSHADTAKSKIYTFLKSRANLAGQSAAIISQAQLYAMHICDLMSQKEMIHRGNHRQGLIAACLHHAFERYDCPRSGQEIAEILDISVKNVSSGINNFAELLIDSDTHSDTHRMVTLPSHLMPRFCATLHLSGDIVGIVMETCSRLELTDILQNHIVEARAAGIIWFVLKSREQTLTAKISRQAVASACGISTSTVQKVYRKIELARIPTAH